MSDMHGLVAGVKPQSLGDALAVAASTGDTVLYVNDITDFDEDGGTLLFPEIPNPFAPTQPLTWFYTTVDDDTSTITLAVGLPAIGTAPVDTAVQVWDDANDQPAVIYKAVLASVDGFDGDPLEVTFDPAKHSSLAHGMRTGSGESVSLERDGSELQIKTVHGRNNALASMQYLQGGLTTRSGDGQPGVDIAGTDSGNPGVFIFGAGGNQGAQLTADGIATDEPGQPRIVLSNSTDPLFDQGGLLAFYVAGTSWSSGHLAAEWSGGPPQVGTLTLLGPAAPSATVIAGLGLSYAAGVGAIANLDGLIINIGASATGGINLRQNTTVTGEIHSTTGGIWMDDLAGGGTTTAQIGASGRVVRATLGAYTTSSRALKTDIQDMTLAEAAVTLNLRPRTYLDKQDPDGPRLPGFIAEEADEAGAEMWVGRDEDGKVAGFRYQQLTVAHTLLIREQRDQIEDLTARLERAEQAIHDLTTKGA